MFWVEGGVLAAGFFVVFSPKMLGAVSSEQLDVWYSKAGINTIFAIWSTAMPFFAIPSFSRLKISDDARMGGTRGG